MFANSLQIAEVFEKDHSNVLKAIDKIPNDEFKSSNFKYDSYFDKKSEQRRMINLTRDGFSLLVMGFTGQKAYRWKIEFIKAFNLMEAKLKSLKSIEQTNRIANLEAIAISKERYHAKQINGYKAQLAKHNEKIKVLKARLTIAENEAKNLSSDDELLEKLEWLFKRALADGVIYAINSSRDKIINDALKKASDEFMSNLHLLKKQ
ncbi:Rha family transcriptional regulator [Campylobacter hyointestinalis]|uniref:Rha family transcriptional regulator n=1 Tax=Campylobacter hyointestinalis TaxID=198 RepID=UPI0009EE418B|nr:Rha family transcriptional regulator [Campylobacter hyointestinalis]